MLTKTNQYPLALPVGTELVGDYVITKVLGAGGFGITYEASERSLERTVAIKEFFPVDIVERDGWALVKTRSKEFNVKYARGLRRFIEEAKAITQFNHPNIVRVMRYFKTNNTAFMVLHYEEGVDMGIWRDRLAKPPTQEQLSSIIDPLLDALALMHESDFLHRDIAPDNIIIRRDNSPILIDFGAARSELTFNSKTVSALVKSGYSPFEQYAKTSREQGPWTDIYSFGATLYQMIAGVAPPDSLSRLAKDDMIPAKKRSKKFYSREFLAAIDHALELKIGDRPQSIKQWRAMLFPGRPPYGTVMTGPDDAHNNMTKSSGFLPTKLHPHGKFGPPPVADLMEKAGLKPLGFGRSAARIAAKVKTPLLKLVVNRKRRKAEAAERARSEALDALEAAPPPRSLRSLLDEMDDRYKDPGPEQAIEKAAVQPPLKKGPKPSLWIKKSRFDLTKITRFLQARWHALARLGKNAAPRKGLPFKSLMALVLISGGLIGWYSIKDQFPKLTSSIQNPSLVRTINIRNPGLSNAIDLMGDRSTLIFKNGRTGYKIISVVTGDVHDFGPLQKLQISAFDSSNNWLATADKNGFVTISRFKETTGKSGSKEIKKTPDVNNFMGLDGPIHAIALTGNKDDIVLGGKGGAPYMWDFSGSHRRAFRGKKHSDDILAIKVYKNYFLTTSRDRTTKLWGLKRANLIRTYRGHKGPVKSVAVFSRSHRMATGSDDKTVKIWSTRSRRIRRTLTGHKGGVTSLAFSNNGKILASGSQDKTIKLWNMANGRLIDSFTGHTGTVNALLFSKDGKRLISASQDGTIRFWDWRIRPRKNKKRQRPGS